MHSEQTNNEGKEKKMSEEGSQLPHKKFQDFKL